MNCSDFRWFIPSHSCKIHGGFCVGPFTPSCDGFEKHAPAPPAPDSGPVWTVIQKPIPGSSDAKHTALSGPLGDIFFSSTQDAQNAAFECNQAFKHGAASKQAEVDLVIRDIRDIEEALERDDVAAICSGVRSALSNLGKG